MKLIDLKNKRFGLLTVIERTSAPINVENKSLTYWLCACNCGNTHTVLGSNLKRNLIQSCGSIEHLGLTDKNKAIKSSAKEVFKNNRYDEDNLSFDEFLTLSQLPCHYCGLESIKSNSFNLFTSRLNKNKSVSKFAVENGRFYYNGLDRINNFLLHDLNNVVPCCKTCNSFKFNLTKNEFLDRIKNLSIDNITYAADFDLKISLTDLFQMYCPKKRNRNFLLQRFSNLKSSARRRNMNFDLTNLQVVALLLFNCNYCSISPDFEAANLMTIDRVDNDRGYIASNCVSSCMNCNIAKNNSTLKEFNDWIIRIKSFNENRYL